MQKGDLPIFTLGGKSHEQGGIGVNITGDKPAYIFSNNKDLKVPKMYAKGGTYANAANKIGKELADISEMESGDVYDKNTASRMKPAVMAKFGGLYGAQEKFKAENGFSNPNMGYANHGGPHFTNLRQFDTGNAFGPGSPINNPASNSWLENYSDNISAGNLFSNFGTPNTTTNTTTDTTTTTTPPPGESKLPWQLYAANAVPGLMNIAKGAFGTAPTLDLGRMDKQDYVNFNPIMNAYNSGQGRNLASLRASLGETGATGSQLRGGYQAGASNAQANAGQFYNQLAPQIAQSKLATDRYNQGIEQQNQQMEMMEDQFAIQNDPMNAFSQGVGQLVNAGTNLYMDNLRANNMGTQMYDMFGKFIGANQGKVS